jgi:putative acetyltransferase
MAGPLQTDISPVKAADYERVVEVWEASVRATHHFLREADIQIFRPMIVRALPDIAPFCLRDSDQQVVGFIYVAQSNVDMLFVHPDWRGQGMGGRLLRYAVEQLQATTLDVNEQNEQALGFYLRMGFEVVGRSELDGTGKPYPLLHMRLKASSAP